jgi:hypothetical protein
VRKAAIIAHISILGKGTHSVKQTDFHASFETGEKVQGRQRLLEEYIALSHMREIHDSLLILNGDRSFLSGLG